MLSRSEPREEIEIATSKLTTMFLNFGKSEPQRSYKHGSYKKKKVYSPLHIQKNQLITLPAFYPILTAHP